MQEGFLENFARHHQGMGFVASQFDVAIEHTPVGGAHANIAANPSREEQESPIEEVPLRGPRKRNIVHPKRLHFGGQPGKDSDDEYHGEHHRFHGPHLHFELLRHRLLLERHGLLLENGVSRKPGFVHHLANLALTVADVGLVHGIDEKVSNHGVQRHGKDTQNHDRDDKEGFLRKKRGEQRVRRRTQ